jgi:organic hydroperoxide reductase OsmC/OhrA
MSEHTATVTWQRGDQPFTDRRYSRVHEWRFDGGATVRASSSPLVVRAPMSDPAAVDPEEAFVASLASCHMLWFLGLAAERGIVVETYEDEPRGFIEPTSETSETSETRHAMTRIVLRPRVVLGTGSAERVGELEALHHEAHRQCFLASALRAELCIEPR